MDGIVLDIIYNVALLFIMMVPGIILKKTGLAGEGLGKGLSNLVLYIAQPALVFLAYLRDYDEKIMQGSIVVLALSVVAHVIFAAVAIPIFKNAPDGKDRMLKFATIFSNAAFMGIPLIAAVLEESCPGATLYASIYNITFNLFLWSLGVYICTSEKDVNKNNVDDHIEARKSGAGLLKALIHPVTIAALVGLVFFIAPINQYVPELAIDALTYLKGLVAPLSMVVLGLRLAEMDFKGVFKDKYMYIFLGLRHIALPLLVVGVIKLLGLVGLTIDSTVAMVVAIMAAAPAATSATMFAEKYDCDAGYVSRLVLISTLLCIATMPLVILCV